MTSSALCPTVLLHPLSVRKKLDDKLEAELRAARIGDQALAKLKDLEAEAEKHQEELRKVCRKI